MKRQASEGRVAQRELVGVDERGTEERIVLWIERRPGAAWAVCRAVNPALRANGSDARPEDIVFEGYELAEALEQANAALEDDVRVLEEDGRDVSVRPFTRKEVLPLLERFFFGR